MADVMKMQLGGTYIQCTYNDPLKSNERVLEDIEDMKTMLETCREIVRQRMEKVVAIKEVERNE